jgi:hypothetical protein
MSAYREYFEAQQLLTFIFHTGHHISPANLEYLIHQVGQRANRMVINNRETEIQRLIQRQTSIITQAAIRPPAPPVVAAPVVEPPVRRNPLEKTKIIAKKKLEESCPEECAICQETPNHKDAICTECKHYYCKSCWNSWMNAERSNKKCPTCRKDMPRITCFKARATRRLIVVEDD